MPEAVVDDRFDILELAGEGGMGRVYRARDRRDGRIVALKILREDVRNEETVSRFRREVSALAVLDDDAIVRYVAHGAMSDGSAYLAMQWIEGEDLRMRLRRGTLRVDDTLVVGIRLAGALAHAHARGLMHRDVKPANVVLADDALERATLIDFGLAREGDTELTQFGVMLGTPTYMAPEQARGERIGPPVDVFALGCILFHGLVGHAPFSAKGATAVLARLLFEEPPALASLCPDVPAPLADLIGQMLRKRARERPDMQRVLEDLSEIRGSLATLSGVSLRTEAIGASEQRIVSVVIAGVPSDSDEEQTLRWATQAPFDAARLATIADRFDAQSSVLPNGSLVAVLSTTGPANDLALRAAELAFAFKRHARVPVGLATGRAETSDGLPVGEAIHRAAMLAPHDGDAVRVDRVTASLLDDRFVQEQTEEGTLVRRRRELGPARTLLGKPTPCVGRDAELAMLDGILAHCTNESVARVVLVTAPAGFGKSRLRHEFLRRVRGRGDDLQIWTARGDSVGSAPFGMIAQMIRQTAGIFEGEPIEESREKLRARVYGEGQERHRIASFLGEMIGAPFEADPQLQAARRDAMLMSDQMRRAFVDFVELESRDAPLLVILEDLQWGDLPTVVAFDAALRLHGERPLLVVAFARPEVREVFPDLFVERGVQPIPLTPLARRAAERLVTTSLGAVPSTVVERLVEQAAGNVFYLEELVRATSEGREAAPTVVTMVQSRLSALDGKARRVLRAASVFGETFWDGGVRTLLGGESAEEIRRWLEALVANELCTKRSQSRLAHQTEYVFRHALVREGAYAMLTDADRVLGHRLAADWLEEAGEVAAGVIAEHYARGDEPARAARMFLRAAEDSLESHDLAAAIDCAQRGVACGAEGVLLGALRNVQAHAHLWRGETAAMEGAASEAVTLLPRDAPSWADAVATLAVAKQRLGHGEELIEVARELSVSLSSAAGDRGSLARAGARVSSLLFFSGRQSLAAEVLDAAERAAVGGGRQVEARIHQARAPRARQAGRPAEALQHLSAAEQAFRDAGDEPNACLMLGNRGFGLSELGAYREALPLVEEALARAERLGLALVAATAKSNLGMLRLRLGDAREAERIERAAILDFESRDRRQEGGARIYLAMILLASNDLDAAEAESRRALALLETAPQLRPYAGAVLGDVLLERGRARDALAVTTEATSWIDGGGRVEEGDALVRLTHARALHATDERDIAFRRLLEARDRLAERAAAIGNLTWRRTFLENVPEHAATLRLAEEWA